MLTTVFSIMLMAFSGNNSYDPGRITQLMSFDPCEYSDSLQVELDNSYEVVKNKDINLSNLTDTQKYDLIFLLGMYRDRVMTKIIDSLLLTKINNRELLAICYFYKYQQGQQQYLGKYFKLLKASSDSLGDSPLVMVLGFLKDEKAALVYLNNNIGKEHDTTKELMCDTYLEIIKKKVKNNKLLNKYRNIEKCCK